MHSVSNRENVMQGYVPTIREQILKTLRRHLNRDTVANVDKLTGKQWS